MHYVYILQSEKDLKFYIGEAKDLEARLAYHNAGLQRSTKNRIPFRVVYYEVLNDRVEALKREKEIKSWKGGIKFKELMRGQ